VCDSCLAEGPIRGDDQAAVDEWNFLSLLKWGRDDEQ